MLIMQLLISSLPIKTRKTRAMNIHDGVNTCGERESIPSTLEYIKIIKKHFHNIILFEKAT